MPSDGGSSDDGSGGAGSGDANANANEGHHNSTDTSETDAGAGGRDSSGGNLGSSKDSLSGEGLLNDYLSSQIGSYTIEKTSSALGPTQELANTAFGPPTLGNVIARNAVNEQASSFSTTTHLGFNSVTGQRGVHEVDTKYDGTYDSHSINGQMLGPVDEIAADVVEALGYQVTTHSIGTVKDIANVVIDLVLGAPTAAIGLDIASAALNAAAYSGIISEEEYNDLNLALAVVAIAVFGISANTLIGLIDAIDRLGFSSLGSNSTIGIDDIMSGRNNDIKSIYTVEAPYFLEPMVLKDTQYKNTLAIPQIQKNDLHTTISKAVDDTKGNRMQVIYQEYRGGLNEVKAPQLIGQNEGQIFNNISTTRGTMRSELQGTAVTSSNLYKYQLDDIHYFVSNNYFTIAKIGNFFYILVSGRSKLGRLNIGTTSMVTEVDILDVDLPAPITIPVASGVLSTIATYTATASLVNLKNSSGVEETYTASITSSYTTDIPYSIINNTALIISGTCSSSTPDGRTILIVINGKEFSTTSSSDVFRLAINDLSFLDTQLSRELWDEYQYAYTYYNEKSGYESKPVFTKSWLRKTGSIKISNIKLPTDTNVDKIYLYRIGGYSTIYRRIAEIVNNHSNTLTEYTDSVVDLLTYKVLDTDNIADILDLSGLIEHKGSLLAFKNNQVYFSKPGKPNVWSEFQSVRVGGTVTAIASVPLGVLILTDNQRTYLLGGTDSTNYILATINNTVGAISDKSVSYVQNSALWLGYEGLMTSIGSAIQNLSRNQVDLSSIGSINYSFSYDKIYYLCGSNYMLSVDFNSQKPSFKKFTISNITSMWINKGKICYMANGKEYTDFGKQGGNLDLHYRAPNFVGGSYDLLKEFNKINLTYKGSFIYKVIIDDTIVLTDSINSGKTAVEEIQIPSEFNEGLYISLELSGVGEIKNFRYIFSYLNNN